ncbi:MAG: hypothetical protein ABSC56_13195 [Solirubrobacteraceae bacterium]|jgi:hypothetical protein
MSTIWNLADDVRRNRVRRDHGAALPRRVAALAAVLSVATAAPAYASTRDYSGSIAGGGTIAIKASFKDGKATRVRITWSDVPTTCDGSEIYSSTTSGTVSGAVALLPGNPSAPERSFYPQHAGFSGSDIHWGVSGRFNKSYSSAKGFFTWQDIEAEPAQITNPTGIKATCNLVQAGGAATLQNFAVTAS